MFFLTDPELSHVYQCPKSKKVHGTFGLVENTRGALCKGVAVLLRSDVSSQITPILCSKYLFSKRL